MNFFKFFFLFLSMLVLNSTVYSHGPSRQKVSEKIEINASPEKVWSIVKKFSNFKWNPSVKEVNAQGEKVDSLRELNFGDAKVIKQKLEKLDDNKRLIGWRIIETNNDIMPVNSYSAKIFVKDAEGGKTLVNYKAGFYRGFMGNDPPTELNDENSKIKVSNFIKESLKGLKKIAESK